MEVSEAAKWYVIHTYSGYEKMVSENIKKVVENRSLQDLIQEIKVPTEKSTEIKNGKCREVEKKLFPGYVIVKMVLNDDTWLVVNKIKGVTGFVGHAYSPESLSQQEVDKLGIEKRSVEVDYSVGDVVVVTSGAFEKFSGKVEFIDKERKKVKVEVVMFGRNTSIEVDLDSVMLESEVR